MLHVGPERKKPGYIDTKPHIRQLEGILLQGTIEQRALVPICRAPGMQEAQLARRTRLTIGLAIREARMNGDLCSKRAKLVTKSTLRRRDVEDDRDRRGWVADGGRTIAAITETRRRAKRRQLVRLILGPTLFESLRCFPRYAALLQAWRNPRRSVNPSGDWVCRNPMHWPAPSQSQAFDSQHRVEAAESKGIG